MPQYPNWTVTKNVDAATLASMLPNIVVKASATAIASNTTPANDPELQNISLGVGTWEIETLLFVVGVTGGASNIITKWAFTGTLTGTPLRSTIGPAASSTVSPTVTTIYNTGGVTWSNSNTYGLGGAVTVTLREECTSFVVATAGVFSVQWSQGTSNASPTTMQIGSRVRVRQIG